MAERTAMPVADDTEAPSAVPGYRVISAGDVLLTGYQTGCGELVVMLDADGPADDASFLVPL